MKRKENTQIASMFPL